MKEKKKASAGTTFRQKRSRAARANGVEAAPKAPPMQAPALTHVDVIRLWESPSLMADEIGTSTDVVRHWKMRGRIPWAWWGRVAAAAEARGHTDVTYAALEAFAQHVAGVPAGDQRTGASA